MSDNPISLSPPQSTTSTHNAQKIYLIYQKIEKILLSFIQYSDAQAVERMLSLLRSGIKILEGTQEFKKRVLEPLEPQTTVILNTKIIEIDLALPPKAIPTNQPSTSIYSPKTKSTKKSNDISAPKSVSSAKILKENLSSQITQTSKSESNVPDPIALTFIPTTAKISNPDISTIHYSKLRNPTPRTTFNYVGIIHDLNFTLFGQCRSCNPMVNTCSKCKNTKGGIRAEMKIVLLDSSTVNCIFWTNLLPVLVTSQKQQCITAILTAPDEFRRQLLEIYRGHPVLVSGQYRPFKNDIFPTITKMGVLTWEYFIPILMDIMPL